jgi:hypothetical protein
VSYWLGVLTPFGLAAVIAAGLAIRIFAINHIQRIPPTDTRRRVAAASRVFASRRVVLLRLRHTAFAVTLGHDWPTGDRVEAVLLDEFLPVTSDTDREG